MSSANCARSNIRSSFECSTDSKARDDMLDFTGAARAQRNRQRKPKNGASETAHGSNATLLHLAKTRGRRVV